MEASVFLSSSVARGMAMFIAHICGQPCHLIRRVFFVINGQAWSQLPAAGCRECSHCCHCMC